MKSTTVLSRVAHLHFVLIKPVFLPNISVEKMRCVYLMLSSSRAFRNIQYGVSCEVHRRLVMMVDGGGSVISRLLGFLSEY